MGSFFKGSDGKQESKPWDPAIPHLDKILGEMGGWYDSAKNEGYISQTGDLDSIYGNYLNELQQSQQGVKDQTNQLWGQGVNGLDNTQAFYDKMMNGGGDITSADITNMANDFINTDLLNGQIDAANRDTARNLMENELPGIDRQASADGAMGSSRTGVSAAIAERGADEKMADTSAAMRGQAYNNAMNQAQSVLSGNIQNQMLSAQGNMNASGQYFNASNGVNQNNQNALGGFLNSAQLGGMLQGANQADKIGNRDYLANLLGQYSNIATGIGGMGGSSTIKNPGTSMFDKLMQGGMVAGSMMGGAGSMGATFSDKRLKKNIKKAGKVKDVEVVTWDWNDTAKELGYKGSSKGVIAQDVMENYPDCVVEQGNFYAVNYELLESKLGQSVR